MSENRDRRIQADTLHGCMVTSPGAFRIGYTTHEIASTRAPPRDIGQGQDSARPGAINHTGGDIPRRDASGHGEKASFFNWDLS